MIVEALPVEFNRYESRRMNCEIRAQREQIEEPRIPFRDQAKQLGVKKVVFEELLGRFTNKIVNLSGQWVGQPLYPDPPTRVGELSFASTHAQCNRLTVGGRNILDVEE